MPLQLGLGLNRRLGGFNPFTPNHLNPYLLFDTRTSMLGELESPTLDLDPAVPSSLDVITATRSGVATYTDINGVIQTADPNTVRVDYTQGEELTPTKFQHIGYTDFSSGWTVEGGTLTESQIQAPDGTTPVYELTENTSTSRHRLFDSGIPLVSGQTYTVSAYVKKVSSGRFFLINSSALNGIKGFLNLDTGVATLTSGTGTIAVTDEGNGWYRLSVSAQATTTNGFVYMQLQNAQTDVNYTGTGASMLIWGPQLEEGTTATAFVPNTTGSPKFIASATYGPRVPMMLIEPSAENLVTDSSLFVELGDATRVGGIDAPDGSTNAKRISNAQAVSGNFAKNQTITIPTGVAADYVGSVYVRGTAGETVNVFMKRASGGTFVTSGGRSVLLTGEWQRVENIALTTDPTNDNLSIYFSSAGETADTIDVWGAQIEEGTVSTSVIPTSGSTVTRAADNLVIDGSAFSDFYNATEGTFYIEATERTQETRAGFITGQGTSQFFLYNNGSDDIYSFDGGASVTLANRPVNELFRAAVTYTPTTKTISMNGAVSTVSVHNGNWAAANILNIGWGGSGNAGYPHINGHIKRLIYWPTHSDSL